jgi:hypothetical protein
VRQAIQPNQESIAQLATYYNVNPKTIATWKKRPYVHDAPMGPKQPHSTIQTKEEEAVIVTFRWQMRLPTDNCLYALYSTLPHLTWSALHRCLKRHGIRRLPAFKGDQPQQKQFTPSPIGSFHIHRTEVHTKEGQLYVFVVIEHPSRFAYAERYTEAIKTVAAQCLLNLIAIVPHALHPALTDNGSQFPNRKQVKYAFKHIFACVCNEHAIAHRLTNTNHPWIHDQVERMRRTLKEATVKIKKDYHQSQQHLTEHLYAFLMADNFAKRLKPLKGLTPYEDSYHCWRKEPARFTMNPYHYSLGLNT